jgi:hypothetical protein
MLLWRLDKPFAENTLAWRTENNLVLVGKERLYEVVTLVLTPIRQQE